MRKVFYVMFGHEEYSSYIDGNADLIGNRRCDVRNDEKMTIYLVKD